MPAMILKRPRISAIWLAVLVAMYLLATANLTFWHKAWEEFATTAGLVSFGVAMLAVYIAVMAVLAFRYVAKPLFIVAILTAAAASYFTDTFGTIVNANMIDNILATNSGEGGEFFTRGFFLHMALSGVLPSAVVIWLRVEYGRLHRRVLVNSATCVVALLVATGLIATHYSEVRAAMRRDFNAMMEVLNPAGPISSAVKVAAATFRNRGMVREPHGRDAKKGDWIVRAEKPVVTVVVVGEAARAMNFSLNGYARPTNPNLSMLPILNFSNVTSCGTETSISLRCMFSNLGRRGFSKEGVVGRESLMDVFRHAGLDVLWWDNDGGSKGVADGVDYTSYMIRNDPDLCADGVCQDDIFLGDLDALLASVKRDTVVVLHQRGSHGPAYYLRYPDTFRPFRPDCRNYDPTLCSHEEIVNAYDNTIAYNDRFLARVIGLLGKHDATSTGAMFYVSDHGESLGENGIYMHGTPYKGAPREQTSIPMIAWASPAYQTLSGLDIRCAKGLAAKAFSHDNVYHTLLGMMDIETSEYRPALDIFGGCRPMAH